MNDRSKKLEKLVRSLYEGRREGRDEWCDWLYENHVFVVAKNALFLARKYGGDIDLAFAGAILHDIADVSISRFSDNHEELSLNIAEGAMIEAGFSDSDRAIVLEDILPKHSCRGDMRPLTLEGKIVASADAIAHIDTDFYLFFAVNNFKNGGDFEALKAKLRAKLDRDFNSKLMFNDEKNFYKTKYENFKQLFI